MIIGQRHDGDDDPKYMLHDGVTHRIAFESTSFYLSYCDVWFPRRCCSRHDGPAACFGCMSEANR